MENSEKRFSKKKIIIILICVAVLIAAGTAFYFIFGNGSRTNHDYSGVESITIDNKNTFTLTVRSPYDKDGIEYEIANPKGVQVSDRTALDSSEKYEAAISKVTYSDESSSAEKSGFTGITVQLGKDFSFEDGKKYYVSISDGAVTEKGGKKSPGNLTALFSCQQRSDSSFFAIPEELKSYDTVELSDAEFKITSSGKDYYVEAEVSTSVLTKLNEKALEEETTALVMSYKIDEKNIAIRTYRDNIELSRSKDGQKLFIKAKIEDSKDLVNGTEYYFSLQEGLLISDDGKLANAAFDNSCSFIG